MKLDPHGLQLTSLLFGIEAGAGQPELYELEADENLLRVPWPAKKRSGGFSVTRKDLGSEAILATRKIRLTVLALLIKRKIMVFFFKLYVGILNTEKRFIKKNMHTVSLK